VLKMTKCFMNGKSCIYERMIDERIANMPSSADSRTAFMIMPFGAHLDTLYQWVIAPCFREGGEGHDEKYVCAPERADDVRQVGFIICEKICRRIQEADYIIVDVSHDNPNVFYEFGLAVALRKDIIPICSEEKVDARKSVLNKLCGINDLMPYPKYGYLKARLDAFKYQCNLVSEFEGFEQMSGDGIVVLYDGKHIVTDRSVYGNTEYDFGELCNSAVGTAISEIFSEENVQRHPDLSLYHDRFDRVKKTESIDLAGATYSKVIKFCKDAACVLIDVSLAESIANYFWLGYIHGIGGNAIPVNSYRKEAQQVEVPVPFDIRALWHIVFEEDHPTELKESLKDILEYIYIRKARYLYREAFWNNILQDNKVSIFLGSLYLHNLHRNAIGDWDYRTAAEIASYLSTSKETMKVTLESPLPKCERVEDANDEYIGWLEDQLRDNNCIIVASADVNDLTEVAMSRIFNRKPFTAIPPNDVSFRGYIAYKKYTTKPKAADEKDSPGPENAFYQRKQAADDAEADSRGFIIREGQGVQEFMKEHVYPAAEGVKGVRNLLGQLIVAKNPLAEGADKWIVIISGISGPATMGIAQMLTGGMYQEFTINYLADQNNDEEEDKRKQIITDYCQQAKTEPKEETPGISDGLVSYAELSEHMLSKLSEVMDASGGEVNALVSVGVYYPEKKATTHSNDDRKVIAWHFPDLTVEMGRIWKNPNNLGCNYDRSTRE